MTNFAADKAGVFRSDAHRFVLGVLSYPWDEYAWSFAGILLRVAPHVTDHEEVKLILSELEEEGLVSGLAGSWKMTHLGFDRLTGPIANEPPEGAAVEGPALIVAAQPVEKSHE